MAQFLMHCFLFFNCSFPCQDPYVNLHLCRDGIDKLSVHVTLVHVIDKIEEPVKKELLKARDYRVGTIVHLIL